MMAEGGAIVCRAPAKLNLFLEVRGRRADGFHELDTVFCELDWSDTLRLEAGGGPGFDVTLECADPLVPGGADNLIVRALARLLGERPAALRITLEKRLPMGGGLGGGSSNAAAALMAAVRLFDLSIAREDLAALALELGSDVPFFLEGGCQRGRGRGEQLSSLPMPGLDFVLLCPPIHCSTRAVFEELAASRAVEAGEAKREDAARLCQAVLRDDREAIAAALFNRLEAPAFHLWPELASLKARLLEAGCLGASLSGSGACIYGIAGDVEQARALSAELPYARVVRSAVDRAGS